MSAHPTPQAQAHPHPHGELVNENVHHEEQDINIAAIVTFVVVLTTVTLVIVVAMLGLFKVLNTIEDKTTAVVSPIAPPAANVSDFPAPSLQTTPWEDLKKLHADEAAFLHGYGWVNEGAGIGRIPIERAKALLLEKGIAVRPGASDASEGTHVGATGESSGGRNLPAGQADVSTPPAPPAPAGAQGATGATGPTGATGATGAVKPGGGV